MKCQAISKKTNLPCQNPTLRTPEADGTHCQVHQPGYMRTPSIRPRKAVGINAGDRGLILRARDHYFQNPITAAELSREFGGAESWWGRVIISHSRTPKYLFAECSQRLRNYLSENVTEIGTRTISSSDLSSDSASAPETRVFRSFQELAADWRKKKEEPPKAVETPPEIVILRGLEDSREELEDIMVDLKERLSGLESTVVILEGLVGEILESLIEDKD